MTGAKFDVHDLKFFELLERSKEVEKVNVGLIGVPYDGATRGRPGARFAPREIRARLYSYSSYCIDYDVDLANLSIRDFGDIDVNFESFELVKQEIMNHLSGISRKADTWVILGGDHSITEPVLSAFSQGIKGKIGLIILDAHHDLRELEGGHISSGMVVGNIIRNMGDKINPRNIAQIGIRGFVNSKYYVDKARELGIMIYTSRDVRRLEVLKIINEVIEELGDVDGIYFSFDVDSVDFIYAPGVNAPSIGGIYPWDVFEVAYELGGNSKVFAMDVTEHAPTYDVAGVTTDLAANAILYFLAGVARRLSE